MLGVSRIFRTAALLMTALAAPWLSSLEPEDLADAWRWRVFDREDGLPTGAISAIGHDRDDFVYAGTDRGIQRYNGFIWTALEAAQPLNSGPVLKIVESGGDVYASTRTELWLARNGLELDRIARGERMLLAAGPLGGVYAVDAAARLHYHLEKETISRVDEGVALPESELLDYAVDDRRIHWLATRDGPYRRDIRTRFRWQLDTELGPELRGRRCLRLYVVKRQTVVRAPVAAQMPAGAPAFELWALFGPGPADVPAGPAHVLANRIETGWRISAVDPSGPAITDLVLDGAGTYVAVTEEGRVFVSKDAKAWTGAPALGIGSVALSGGLLDPHGYLWFRGGTSSIVRFDGLSRRWERYHEGLGLPSNNVLSLIEASDGAVWAGTDNGVFRFPPGPPAQPTIYRAIGNRALRQVTGLAEDHTGKVWIASESFEGAYFYHEGSWNRFEPRERREGADQGLSADRLRRIVSDRGGDLWFLAASRKAPAGEAPAPPGYTVYRYSASVYTLSSFRAITFPFGPVNDLLQAQDKSYWIATEEGLARASAGMDDPRLAYTESNGLLSNRVWAIAEAADGAIWVCYDPGTTSGVTRLRGNQTETFDERNGLASPKAWSVACTVSPEGADVWLGTDRGIIRFDGECWYNLGLASLPPQASQIWPLVVGGQGSVDGESILVGTFGQGIYRFRRDERRRPRITLLNSERTPDNVLTFRWDGRDFKNETPPNDLRFRTRIDDQPWTPFVRQHRRTVPDLAPGDHVLHIELRDLDGNSNREKYSLRFNVPPLPGQSSPLWWAAAAGAAGSLALAALIAAFFLWAGRPVGPAKALARAARACGGFPGAVLVVSSDGRLADVTGARRESVGLPAELAGELRGRPASLLPLFRSQPAREALARALHGHEAAADAVPVIPGEPRVARLRAFPVLPEREATGRAPAGAVVLVEEVTQEREADAMRERSRRLEALQDLAGRISTRLEPGADPELAEALRRFSGEGAGTREPLAPAELVHALLQAPRNGERPEPRLRMTEAVHLEVLAPTGLWKVRGDRASLLRAVEEILRNALDAMPQGGKLSVRLANRRIESDPGDLPDGPYVELEVRDSGPGLPAGEADRVFDPFFSTKPRDRAQGLGLSIAYGLVRAHAGDVRIASRAGEGAVATLLLPADPAA